MSAIVQQVTIRCDSAHFLAPIRYRVKRRATIVAVGTPLTIAGARRHAKASGWTRGRRDGVLGDWCPACSRD